MKKKFSAERSREIRQWIQLVGSIGVMGLSIYLSTKFENGIRERSDDILRETRQWDTLQDQIKEINALKEQLNKNVSNTNKRFDSTVKDFNKIYNKANQQRIQDEIIEAKHKKETELNKAIMNGDKVIKFTRGQWNERYLRYGLILQTYGNDGYYVPDYEDGRVYIYIIEN